MTREMACLWFTLASSPRHRPVAHGTPATAAHHASVTSDLRRSAGTRRRTLDRAGVAPTVGGSVAAMTLELHAYGDPVERAVPPVHDLTPRRDARGLLGGARAPDGDGG
jgi:hypothetical protein